MWWLFQVLIMTLIIGLNGASACQPRHRYRRSPYSFRSCSLRAFASTQLSYRERVRLSQGSDAWVIGAVHLSKQRIGCGSHDGLVDAVAICDPRNPVLDKLKFIAVRGRDVD